MEDINIELTHLLFYINLNLYFILFIYFKDVFTHSKVRKSHI